MEKFDVVEKPLHYNSGDIEVIDIIEELTKGFTGIVAVSLGNVIKYVARARYKNGKEDIKKATWYARKALSKLDGYLLTTGHDAFEYPLTYLADEVARPYKGMAGAEDLAFGVAISIGFLPTANDPKLQLEGVIDRLTKLHDGWEQSKVKIHNHRIAVDIDNVLTTLESALASVGKFFGKPIPEASTVTEYDLSLAFGLTKEEVADFWVANHDTYARECELTPIYDKLYDRYMRGNEVILITNRPDSSREVTEQWLKDNNVVYHQLIMTGGRSKLPILEEQDIHYIIEDNPNFVDELDNSHLSDKVYTIIIDQPYNKYTWADEDIDPHTGERF